MSLDKKDQELHDEMLKELLPFVELLEAKGFSYCLNIARAGHSANYAHGSMPDLASSMGGLASRNTQIYDLFEKALACSLD